MAITEVEVNQIRKSMQEDDSILDPECLDGTPHYVKACCLRHQLFSALCSLKDAENIIDEYRERDKRMLESQSCKEGEAWTDAVAAFTEDPAEFHKAVLLENSDE
ncbi:hypothetical protein [Methylomonas sp. AM2-LC]|uniref:hypothetical protein n=1 Tax=Methylomonas sp. AM2-LC TaxID=3153301 RepID=UPI00326353AE